MKQESINLLLIEDNPSDSDLIEIHLSQAENAKFNVTVSNKLLTGIKQLKQHTFDIVLLDLGLPDCQGLESFLQVHQVRSETPIILLTGLDDEQIAKEAINAGAQDYLVKGEIQPELISRTLAYAIERKRSEQRMNREKDRTQHYLDIAGVILLALDINGYVEMINQKGCQILGYNEDEIIGQHWMSKFVPKRVLADSSFAHNLSVFGEIEGFEVFENPIITKSGEERIISWRNALIYDETGEVTGTLSSGEDITERKQAVLALSESEERYRSVAQTAIDAIISVDSYGEIITWNPGASKIFGYAEDEIIGQQVTKIMPEGRRNQHMQGLARVSEGGKHRIIGETIEQEGMRKDGAIFPIEISISTWNTIQGKFYTGIIRDITDRKITQNKIKESEEKYRNLFETSPQGIVTLDLKGIITDCNSAFLDISGYSEKEILGKQIDHIPNMLKEDAAKAKKIFNFILAGKININHFEFKWHHKDGRLRDGVIHLGIMKTEGTPIGLQATFQDITDSKQHNREMEVIANVTLALRQALSDNEMVPIVIDQVTNILDATGAVFIFVDPINNKYSRRSGFGVWSDFQNTQIDPGGITDTVIKSGESYINNHAKTQPDPRDSNPGFTRRANAVACVPLITHEDIIGTLWIGRDAPINGDSLRLLNSIANIAANAIQRAALYDKTKRSLDRLQALHNIDTAINTSLDVNFTLKVLTEQVIQQLHVDATSVFLFDEENQTLKYAAGKGFHSSDALENASLHLGDSFAGRAALERRPIRALDIEDYTISKNFWDFITKEGFKSYIGVPLISKNLVVGVMEVYNRTPLNPENDWMGFLETLAGQAAIAIDNASLYYELQHSHKELSRGYDQTIEGWARTLEMRDDETEGHSQRVTDMTVMIAEGMGLEEDEIVQVRRGAILHDIGKMAIPDEILHKPGPLTDEEWGIMKSHPQLAYEWLSQISFLEFALNVPHYHHEKWDGTGYPEGLKGEEIPLPARIFAIADVWDALLSDRPYRKAWSKKKTLAYIGEQAGIHFDPDIVKVFLNLVDS